MATNWTKVTKSKPFDYDTWMLRDQEKHIKKAEKKGFEIVDALPTILQIDWDSPRFNEKQFKWQLKRLRQCKAPIARSRNGWPNFWLRKSVSGNWHIYVQLSRPVGVYKRIALQMALGSDSKREDCNLKRVMLKVKRPIVFFEVKEKD